MKNDARKHKIGCYISNSVKNEINDKITMTTNYLGNVVRQMIQIALADARRDRGIALSDPMSTDDIRVLEDLFASFHQEVRRRNVSLTTPISHIEEWIILFLTDRNYKQTPITIPKFLVELTKKLLLFTSEMQDIYDNLIEFQNDYIKTENITPDTQIVRRLKNIGLHSPDNIHVASAYFYQVSNSKPVVFVTFDHKTILRKRYDVWNSGIPIRCSDPLYALHHIS